MGAEYTCIITKEKIKVPVQIPHFVKNEVITIPVNCGGEGSKMFTEHFNNGKLENTENCEADENHPQIILMLLESIGLTNKKYLIHFEADWADIPCEGYSAAFDNGNVIKETIWEMYVPGTLVSAFDFLDINYGKDVHFSHRYYVAKEEYLKIANDFK
jgi:hypothetical protein